MTGLAKSEPRRIIADGFKIAICPAQASVVDYKLLDCLRFAIFSTVVHADIVVGFACTLRMSCDAGGIVIAT